MRVVNVVDLMRLEPDSEHPARALDREFDAMFTTGRAGDLRLPRLPDLIHRLTYRRANHYNFHVRGYKEEGTTTTPFDMVMLNDLDRFHLVMDVIDRVPGLGNALPGCASRWQTRDCAAGHTRASTAKTHPRCATGAGLQRRAPTTDAAPAVD